MTIASLAAIQAWRDRRRVLLRDVYMPSPRVTLSEWADRNRVLSRAASAEPGQYRTDRAEYLRGIADAITGPAQQIVVMKAGQVGYSELLCNAIGYYADADPCSVLLVVPTIEFGRAFSTDRIATMFAATARLRAKISAVKSRDSQQTMLHRTWPGGYLQIVGANAPSGLSSRPIRVVICDELDRFPPSAGVEGDPVSLAFKRSVTYGVRRKLIIGSTPTIKGVSRIEKAFEKSSRQYYEVPCPHCGVFQRLVWSGLHWEKGNPESAAYVCIATEDRPGCGVVIEETQKAAMVRAGRWVPEDPSADVVGFAVNSLYSPWQDWPSTVREWLAAQGHVEELKHFVNGTLGEVWDEAGEQIPAHVLFERLEEYAAPVPDGVACVVAGVDVQSDALIASAWGFGVGEESWLIADILIPGDTASAGGPWIELDRWLHQAWESEYGIPMGIDVAFVDSGYATKAVYGFTRDRIRRRIYASKGANTEGAMLLSAPKRLHSDGGQVILFTVGTSTAKDSINSKLRVPAPGPGYVHLPGNVADREFIEEITSEKKVTRYDKAHRPIRSWMLARSGVANHRLDCFVYALAALAFLGPRALREMADRVEKLRAAGAAKREQEKKKTGAESPVPESPPAKPEKPPNWVNRWKR